MIHLSIAETDVPALLIILLGLVIGALSGFFGVGGGFLLTPLLNALFGIPYTVAVGSSLSQMIGLSSAAALRHARLGNVDYRLGGLMLLGAGAGTEFGTVVLSGLKGLGSVSTANGAVPVIVLAMGAIYAVLLAVIGTSVGAEAIRAARRSEDASAEPSNKLISRLRAIRLRPVIALPASGIESFSVWVLIAVGFVTGFASGLLGVGGGVLLVPALIYAMGCPTLVAIGTGAFQTVFTAAFGTYAHSLRGNVDLLLVLLMLIGSTVGAHIGAGLTSYVDASRVRGGFAVLCFVGLGVVVARLVQTLLA